jgi:PAS domain S-box-containing protein
MQIIGTFGLGYVHPDDRAPILGRFRDVVQVPGARGTAEFRLRHKLGHWFWIETVVVNLLDDPHVRAIVVTSRDITERKRAARALRESEGRHRALYERSPVGIYRTTPDGRILDADPALLGMLGFGSFAELAARNLESSGFEPDYPRREFKERLERDGEVRGLESVWTTKDGRRVNVRENAVAIRDANGVVIEYEGAVFGLSTDEIIGKAAADPSWSFLREDGSSMPVEEHPVNRVMATRQPLADLVIGLDRRGAVDRVWLLANAFPELGADGRIRQVVVTFVAITERRNVERRLLHTQKLEAVGRLASGVAHDFNNILQAMMMTSQLLRLTTAGHAEVEAALSEIDELVKRATGLTRQLLIFSRQEAGRRESLDLRRVVEDLMNMLRRLVRENVTLIVELAPEPLPVQGDHGQLDQVLMNLVVNACDAMPAGGRLAIRTGATGRKWVWLAIEDTGHGIPAAIRDRIFEPFFTSKGAGRGTGLGLSVVHGIVAAHGGRIEVASAEGDGSTFRIVLPRGWPAESSAIQPAVPSVVEMPRGGSERILVVEDERTARESLRGILASLGYDVVAIASGEEAGRLPAGPRFDLLLTDVVLPGVAGPDLARGLLARWPELKVILMSGYAGDEVLRSGIAAREVRFLQKPFDMTALAREVLDALRDRRQPGQLPSPPQQDPPE